MEAIEEGTRGNRRLAHYLSNARKHGTALPMLVVGALSLLFFVVASILHIATTETANVGHTIYPSIAILAQPYDLVMGKYAGDTAMVQAICVGWMIEIVYLVFTIGFDLITSHLIALSSGMVKFFRVGAAIMIGYDFYTDFMYGNQLLFAIVTAFGVAFFGLIGCIMTARGLKDLASNE